MSGIGFHREGVEQLRQELRAAREARAAARQKSRSIYRVLCRRFDAKYEAERVLCRGGVSFGRRAVMSGAMARRINLELECRFMRDQSEGARLWKWVIADIEKYKAERGELVRSVMGDPDSYRKLMDRVDERNRVNAEARERGAAADR